MPGQVGGRELPQHVSDRVHQGPANGVLRGHDFDQPSPAFVAGGQRAGEQITQVVDLHAPLAHAGDELVVLVLGPLHPEHVVEEQVVMIGGRQALETELRAVDHDLPQLAHF